MTECTTPTTSSEIHPSWFEHPLVAGAIERSHGDPLQVVENVYRGLKWLDEHADGKSFDEASAIRYTERRNQDSVELFRQRLQDEGVPESQISAIVDYEAPMLGSLVGMPLKQRMEVRQRIAYLNGLGWPHRVIARHMGLGMDAIENQIRCAGGRILTDIQRTIAQRAIETSNTTAAKEHGVALSSVSRWRQAYVAQTTEPVPA